MVVFSFISWKHAGMNNIDSIGYDEETVWQKFSLSYGWWGGLVGWPHYVFQYHGYEHGGYMHCLPVIISYRIIDGGMFYRFSHHRDY